LKWRRRLAAVAVRCGKSRIILESVFVEDRQAPGRKHITKHCPITLLRGTVPIPLATARLHVRHILLVAVAAGLVEVNLLGHVL
jgi:hypothetical protein